MLPITIDATLIVFNASRGLPNTAKLIDAARRAQAGVIVCLQFDTAQLDADAVCDWVARSSEQLRTSGVHLVSFNPDLGLALRRPLNLTAGLHPVAPHVWLIVRLWTPPGRAARAAVTFVGPSSIQREGLHGSFWADELLKPEDVAAMPPTDIVVADTEDDLTVPSSRTPRAHSPSRLHPFLGRAVVLRASARSVWAAAPEGAACSPGRVRPGEHAIVRLGRRY